MGLLGNIIGVTEIAEMIEPLHVLADGRRDGVKYFRSLLDHTDEFVRSGAICWLIEQEAIGIDDYEAVLAMRHMPCVRKKAFANFASRFGPQKAKPFMPGDTQADSGGTSIGSDSEAEVDSQARLDTEIHLFRQTGKPDHIFQASIYAEEIGGWRAAMDWLVRAMLLDPTRPRAASRTLKLISDANQNDELEAVLERLERWNLYPMARKIHSARLLLGRGKTDEFFSLIATMPIEKLGRIAPDTYGMIAEATAMKGDFVGAVKFFELQNTAVEPPNYEEMGLFLAEIEMLESLPISDLPPDDRTKHVMMLGFPRSGTTLLEMAMSSHPELETFEEVPTFRLMIKLLKNRISECGMAALSVEDFLEARRCYYEALDIRIGNVAAVAYIDKMPIRSAYAGFLKRIFPDKRYIFSIRHPYDVVLSCFKTPIKANMAMEYFKLFSTACALYDHVMTNWFACFPNSETGGNEHVCPVRYDALVRDFESEMRRILAFLGVGWRDEVADFATVADRRKVKTPSYKKVRQGLNIGVQSSWQDYRFLFETPAAEVLHPWVKRFGYNGLR